MNDLAFVKNLMQLYSRAGIAVWLFGGRAEELSGVAEPRDHHDVDLLCLAESFAQVDDFIVRHALAEIPEKHMPHKRAVLVNDVLVEILLVQGDETGFFTILFDRRWDWPSDIFTEGSQDPPMASRSSLVSYRLGWDHRQRSRNRS